jgi:plastocyanin
MQYMPGQPMPGMQPRQASVTVNAKDDTFDPANVTIQPGQTVRFMNNGKHVHTVTSNDNKFDSGDIPPGRAFDVTFMSPGTYKYHCKHHKGMEGTITVQAAKSGGGGGAAKVGE